ncbi:MAG: ABC transporter permease [Steroidobacteraceae bacterium]
MSNPLEKAARPISANNHAHSFLRTRQLAPSVGLFLMVLVFSVLSENFFSFGNFINLLLDSSVLLIIAIASTAVILTGAIDLSVGSTLALCAYVGAMLSVHFDSTTPLILMPMIGLGCGLINGLLVAYGRLPSFLVTLGTYFVFDGLADYFAGGQPVTIPYGGVADLFTGFLARVPIVTIWASVVLVVAIGVLKYTKWGRYIYAVGGNEKTAKLVGVPVKPVKVYAFATAGFLSGLAGILQIVKIQSASPGMGQPFLLPSIAAVVMGGTPLSGGIGGPLQSLLGVLVIAILTNGMIMTAVNPFLQNVTEGVVVIVAVALTMNRRSAHIVK